MVRGRKAGFESTTLVSPNTTAGSGGSERPLALTILYHPRLERIGDRAVLADLSADNPALLSRMEPVFAPPGQDGGEPLGDEHLSRRPLTLVAVEGGGVRLELGESSTVVVVRGHRAREPRHFDAGQLQRGVVLEIGHRIVLLLHPQTLLGGLLENRRAGDGGELVGESEGLRRVLCEIQSVADLELPVLLRGETGTGKELVARAIHQASRRRERPFVAVNLGAISPSLAIAELFGSERGAFTGSVRRQAGYFEQARGGTLFLDEIGEAPIELQVALLRVLETGDVQTVGSQELRKADVRIIAATDADLEAKVAGGGFRAPLLHRLATYEIGIPPLRRRRDDIGRLIVRFLREELSRIGEAPGMLDPGPDAKPWLPSSLVARLAEYDWPGNVRQLRNVIRQLVLGNRGRSRAQMTAAVERLLAGPGAGGFGPASVGRPALGPDSRGKAGPPSVAPPRPSRGAPASKTAPELRAARRKPSEVAEAELAEVLPACRWDLAAAAQRLGISRASMYVLFERYPRFRTAADLTSEEILGCHREHGGDLARMAAQLEVSERALARRVREMGIV